MQDNVDEDRPQASVKICGHVVFDTESSLLTMPQIENVPTDSLAELQPPNL